MFVLTSFRETDGAIKCKINFVGWKLVKVIKFNH